MNSAFYLHRFHVQRAVESRVVVENNGETDYLRGDDITVNILCVDDEPAFLEITEGFLKKIGQFEVQTATSAREALEMLASRDIDAIVSDYQMPEMDGLEFLEAIREGRGSNIPFIMFTGRGREEVAAKAFNLGVDRYMQKRGDPTAQFHDLAQAIEQEVESWRRTNELERINWLLSKDVEECTYQPPYGDLTESNTGGEILYSLEEDTLADIVNHFMILLNTSSAIYEKNGDYALGIFSSGWCQFLDRSSRALCGTEDNREALESGKWLCHECCWEASKESMEKGGPVDVECKGGIRLYAVPIRAGDEIIGAINFGYGDPPRGEDLVEIAEKYGVEVEKLRELSAAYQTRPSFIINAAENRLETSARLIGEIVEKERSRKSLKELNRRLMESEQRKEELNSLLRAIRDVNQLIVQESDVEALLERSCEILLKTREYYDVFVALFDDGDMTAFVHEGERDRGALEEMVSIDDRAPRCLREVYEGGAERVIKSTSEYCEVCEYCDLDSEHTTILVPMVWDHTISGVLSTCLKGREMIGEELELLREVAGDLAFALSKIEADERLKNSERKFKELFERIESGVAVYEAVDDGEEFVIEDVNQAVERIEDVDRTDILGRRVTEVFPGVEHFGLLDVFRRVWNTGEAEHHPVSFYEDERISGWRKNYVYRLPSGEIVRIYRDVTEKKRVEDRLRRSEQRYRRLFRTMTQGVVYQGPDGKITSANPAAERILGVSLEEMNDRSSESQEWGALREDGSPFPGREHPSMVALRTGEEVTGEVMGVYNPREQEYRWIKIDAIPLFDGSDEPSEVYTIFDDITDRKKGKEELKERVKELNCLHGISRLYEERGVTLGELFQQALSFIPPSWHYPEVTRARLVFDEQEYTTPGFQSTEWSQRSDIVVNGIKRGFLEVVYIERKDEGDEGPFLSEERELIETITDQIGRIVEREESKGREEFLNSLLRHDVRNKVQVATGYLDLMKEIELPKGVRSYLDRMEKSMKEASEIIEKVSSLRQAQDEDISEVNIRGVIEEAVEHSMDIVEESGMDIDTSGVEEHTVLAGTLLNQLFSNLIENSAYHSGGGLIRIGTVDEGEKVLVTVEDGGMGIPPDRWGIIFDKGFSTDKSRGTGLGLFIAKRLLEIYGGKIGTGDSELGGARFEVRLRKPEGG